MVCMCKLRKLCTKSMQTNLEWGTVKWPKRCWRVWLKDSFRTTLHRPSMRMRIILYFDLFVINSSQLTTNINMQIHYYIKWALVMNMYWFDQYYVYILERIRFALALSMLQEGWCISGGHLIQSLCEDNIAKATPWIAYFAVGILAHTLTDRLLKLLWCIFKAP